MAKDEPDIEAHLSGLNLEGLVALRHRLDGLIGELVETRRRELMAEMEQLSSFTRNAQAPAKPTATRMRPPAKKKRYRSKLHPHLIWEGRGRRPKWLEEEMAATGEPLESFLIDEAAADEHPAGRKS
jgi:DNA-binding protein H-NS